MGFFDNLKNGLLKTKKDMSQKLDGVFAGFRRVDEDFLDELGDALIMSDLGVKTAAQTISKLRAAAKTRSISDALELKDTLREILAQMLGENPPLKLETKPSLILIVGVNGAGKTTTVGKLAAQMTSRGKKVLIAAADTFRAAAGEQLAIWAERAGADIVIGREGTDPASVVFDSISAAKARGADVILCDTAGRLHNKQNLLNELSKIKRVIERELPDADRQTLLVLDATVGQNALTQARQFGEAAAIDGIVLTKLDGTAKGGVVCAIAAELGVPVRFIGVGEGVDDLIPFDAADFTAALID